MDMGSESERTSRENWLPRAARVASRVVAVDSVGSTNALADQLVRDGSLRVDPGEAAVVAARRQTAGRGRLDHVWASREGRSFTMSFVVAVPRSLVFDDAVNGWIQMIAGLAAIDAIEGAVRALGLRLRSPLRLKWPNDVFLDGRKLGGILCQLSAWSDGDGIAGVAGGISVDLAPGAEATIPVIIGIGLNLAVPTDELPTQNATSLHLHLGGPNAGIAPSKVLDADGWSDAIAAGIAAALAKRLQTFAHDPHAEASALRNETESVCLTLGRTAVAHFTDGTELTGEAIALNSDASLTIRTPDGRDHRVTTADVSVLPRE